MNIEISVVMPVYNEEAVLIQTYRRLKNVLANYSAELIFVDDGSSDQSPLILENLAQHDPHVKVLFLSRNFGHQSAVTAGLRYAQGDATVILDADLQDPPELIPDMVRQWHEGYDVVYGVRDSRQGETWFKRLTAGVFYHLLRRMSEVDIPPNVGDFRLLTRSVVNVLNAMPEPQRFLRGMAAWAGFRQIGVHYVRDPRAAGATKYPLRRMWRLSIDAMTGFTATPLRVGTRLAMLVAVIAASFSVWLIYQKLHHPAALVLGWTSLMVTVLWLGALQLLVMGIIGEYVARIVEQTRGRPLYVIARTANVDVMDATTASWQLPGS